MVALVEQVVLAEAVLVVEELELQEQPILAVAAVEAVFLVD